MSWFRPPPAIFWRCRDCKKGLMTPNTFRFHCLLCGGRYVVPVTKLTFGDRVRMWGQGFNPLTRHIVDKDVE